MTVPAEIEKAADDMPSFSPILSKVAALSREMNASPRDLVKVVMMDPVLTGKVIQLVNSSFYGLGQRVQSLSQAILLLGLNTVKNLAISTVMISALFVRGKGAPFNPDLFWKHCLGTAASAKFLAKALDVPEKIQEAVFVAGLIHDIGKVLFVKTDPARYDKALQESRRYGVSLAFAELCYFGCDHTQTGGLLARKWKLDADVVDVIEKHHDMQTPPEGLLAPLVSIGNTICKSCRIGESGNPIIEAHAHDLTKQLGLDAAVLSQAEERIPRELDKAEAFLSIHQEGDHP